MQFRAAGYFSFRASARKKYGAHLAQTPGGLRKQNPGFCAARAAIGRFVKRFSRFGRNNRRFLMARARIVFRGTAGNSGDFGSEMPRKAL